MKWFNVCEKTDCISDWGSMIAAVHLNKKEIILVDSGARKNVRLLAEVEKRDLLVFALFCVHSFTWIIQKTISL